jgi:hypothetical protein
MSLTLPLVLGGVALAVLVAGAGLYGSAEADYQSAKDACAPHCTTDPWLPSQSRAEGGYTLFALGGALAAVDIGLWIYRWRLMRSEPRAWAAPMIGAGHAALVIGGGF